ncbi:MAG: hypothetical protein M3032_03750 [Verrucomicrobiota bacterium]|nr:hypothetical protein [Verrucomicrobiota bacterium]
MKWLSGGLTFVNAATVIALLLGSLFGGLGLQSAALSFELAFVVALAAAYQTSATAAANEPAPRHPSSNRVWFWIVASCFAFFIFRSFCWLIFIDGNQLKVQSPNNLGDLALHITYIKNFALGVPLWPDNPIHYASRMRYPAGTDLFNALLDLAGVDVIHGLVWAGVVGSIATFYALYRWGGVFTVAGFLFNGGLAGLQIFQTWKFVDYQGDKTIAWKSLALSMLVTQRGLLYALPAGLLLLYQWRAKYVGRSANELDQRRAPLPFWVELTLYASMPLFHIHTFLALSLIAAWLFAIGNHAARKQLATIVGTAFIPATFFVWTITDHFQARSLLELKPGWVQNSGDFKMPFLSFWAANFGLWPLFVLGLLGLCFWRARKTKTLRNDPALAFLAPAALLFLVACLVKTAPWEWDNIKLIIWAYLIMLPFLWSELIGRTPLPVRLSTCLVLFVSGFVSLFGGLVTNKSGHDLADRAEVDGIGMAVRKLPAEARFAAQPTYNHPLLLQGRKLVLGYLGHVWTQGFDYSGTLNQLNALLDGAPNWREQARDLHARYLFWGREEKANHPASTRPWERETRLVVNGPWGAVYDLTAGPEIPGEESE